MPDSPNSSKMRSLRALLFTVCATAIIVLVVACQPQADPLETPFADVTGGIPNRGVVVDTSIPIVAHLKDGSESPTGFTYPAAPGMGKRTTDQVTLMNRSCVACHTADNLSMHKKGENISCIDCHGGNQLVDPDSNKELTAAQIETKHIKRSDELYEVWKKQAHVQPRLPELWKKPGNPTLPGALVLQESNDYIRFVNPGDLRAATMACGNCHEGNRDNTIVPCEYAVNHVRTNMMSHGSMLWEAALYNNGASPRKNAIYAEFYDRDGKPAAATANPIPTTQEAERKGWLAKLWPVPRWEITEPGNILRVFERGGGKRSDVGSPDPEEDAGNPDVKLSDRGFGTEIRTDPVFISLQKTRLMDPTLNLFGTNDHAGDFRGSGCSACHVVYANDHSPIHSAIWAKYGNRGESFSTDKAINPTAATQPAATFTAARSKGVFPVQHQFERSAPTSSCIVCHVHPGTNVVNAYLGYTWWDNETDGQFMYPRQQRYPTPDDEYRVNQSNPEGSAVRGLWSNPNFLDQVGSDEFNAKLKHTQFADFHGHGWVFRAVFKQDRHGNMLDHDGNVIPDVTAAKMKAGIDFQSTPAKKAPDPGTPVHLKDIHLEMGMHCVDCHFRQDAHGDGNLYGETRAAVEVDCVDCHGTVQDPAPIAKYVALQNTIDKLPVSPPRVKIDSDKKRVVLRKQQEDLLPFIFSGNAAKTGKDVDADELAYRRELLANHFGSDGGKLIQKPSVPSDPVIKPWVLKQVADTAVPPVPGKDGSVDQHAQLASFAHTVRKDPTKWGATKTNPIPADTDTSAMGLAHSNSRMSCYACHSSWNTSCFGCHLPMRANQRKPMLHNEGAITRNYSSYNYQTLRDDVYMLGIDSTVKENKIVPVRSACAVMVSSQNLNREWIYHQQQTVSTEGYSGTAFSPYFPHTVRTVETKQCTDCHVAKAGDNNAVLAQLLMQGTHAVNFIGRYAWVAEGDGGLQAVAVTEHDEPQAVIGSRLHEIAYPDYFAKHQAGNQKLTEAYDHQGTVLDLQMRGEYLYAACGRNGFIAYDIAHIDDKNFSERIQTAPVSPLGQQFYVPSKYATAICSPSTMAIDPTRPHYKENGENPDISLLYAFLYMTDKYEGLIVIGNPLTDPKPGVSTLLDGDPDNNFLQRALTFNPNGMLSGARSISLYGTYAYICCDSGIRVLDLKDPLHPRFVETPGLRQLKNPKKIVFQFRYGFAIDDDGVKAINMTNPENPMLASLYDKGMAAECRIEDARDICLCRTYAYVAAGKGGLVILNIEKPEDAYSWNPITYGRDGTLVDATAVRVGMTNSSLFAYVADGVGGLKVLQLTSPDDTPTYLGFSPQPTPRLIATYPTHGPAISLSSGLDRDRAVDESGNQLSVFGRRGARPFTLEEQQKLYMQTDPRTGRQSLYTVSNQPWTDPLK